MLFGTVGKLQRGRAMYHWQSLHCLRIQYHSYGAASACLWYFLWFSQTQVWTQPSYNHDLVVNNNGRKKSLAEQEQVAKLSLTYSADNMFRLELHGKHCRLISYAWHSIYKSYRLDKRDNRVVIVIKQLIIPGTTWGQASTQVKHYPNTLSKHGGSGQTLYSIVHNPLTVSTIKFQDLSVDKRRMHRLWCDFFNFLNKKSQWRTAGSEMCRNQWKAHLSHIFVFSHLLYQRW